MTTHSEIHYPYNIVYDEFILIKINDKSKTSTKQVIKEVLSNDTFKNL